MRHINDAEPIVDSRFQRRDGLADAVHEDFATSPRDRPKASLRELREDLFQWQSENLTEMNELARTESMDVDLRELAFDVRKQVEIPLQRQLGMVASLHKNLRAAEGDGFLDFLVDFIVGDHVGVVVAFHPVEGAEFAVNVANVRVIDVPVDNVSYDLIPPPLVRVAFGEVTSAVSESAEFFERQLIKPARL